MPSQLYLIGTVHNDFDGPRRLEKILEVLQPDQVTVEYDQNRAINYHQLQVWLKTGIVTEEKLARVFLREFSGTYLETSRRVVRVADYEYGVSLEYCQRRGINLHFSEELASAETEIVLKDSQIWQYLNSFLNLPPEEAINHISQLYQKIDEEEIASSELERFALESRDKSTEKVIRALDRRVVQVSGATHVFGAYDNLYQRLQDLNPTRIKLCDADNEEYLAKLSLAVQR